ncbi:DUF4232 domain-containing protein [Streptomyces lunaelactis]|uniref:DUF4232 domain-containing protein n=1 Tax=Streptomyces lunaelactis TaxID=1535768 RepID=UPI001585B9E2|nr:DUF4232 domain-containing protein [Streptomyces lunaelactis]NUK04212.1 DUF4232 domain-containing protein [Streptomyces lunaelactis]NUK20037.1 DUF4232 domain-containing protein [Streptomyces lunaelactis]
MRKTAVAAALLAALSLTACQSTDDGKKPDASAPSTSAPDAPGATKTPATGRTGQPAANPERTPAGSGKARDTGTGSGTGSGTDPAPVTTACVGENTKVTVSQVSRPINHLLLTLTNTGSKACNAYHAPLLRFDDAQAPTRVMDDSRPQAVVTLAPGESAYASIILSGDSSENGHTAKALTVHFAPRSGSGSTGTAPDRLTLPAGTYIDDNAAVSYWQSDMSDALTY